MSIYDPPQTRIIQVRVPSLAGFIATYWPEGSRDPEVGETLELKDDNGNRKAGKVSKRHWIVGDDRRAVLHIEIDEKNS